MSETRGRLKRTSAVKGVSIPHRKSNPRAVKKEYSINNFETIKQFISENYELKSDLSNNQIASIAVNWIAEILNSESREVGILKNYLHDASAIGLDHDDAQVFYGQLIPISKWATKNGYAEKDNGNIRKYAREGRIVGAQKIGRNWLVPEKAPLLDASN